MCLVVDEPVLDAGKNDAVAEIQSQELPVPAVRVNGPVPVLSLYSDLPVKSVAPLGSLKMFVSLSV